MASNTPSLPEFIFASLFSISSVAFGSLVLGNYLVFASSVELQHLGSDFLTPVYWFSVGLLRVSPFDEGLWAFSSFLTMLCCLAMLRTRQLGLYRALSEAFTLVGPLILISFEAGVLILIPGWFFGYVTNFVEAVGLGGIVTNAFVLLVSTFVLLCRTIFLATGLPCAVARKSHSRVERKLAT